MELNPWSVDSIESFSFYYCPECIFRTKEEDFFQIHAIENHVNTGGVDGQKKAKNLVNIVCEQDTESIFIISENNITVILNSRAHIK